MIFAELRRRFNQVFNRFRLCVDLYLGYFIGGWGSMSMYTVKPVYINARYKNILGSKDIISSSNDFP